MEPVPQQPLFNPGPFQSPVSARVSDATAGAKSARFKLKFGLGEVTLSPFWPFGSAGAARMTRGLEKTLRQADFKLLIRFGERLECQGHGDEADVPIPFLGKPDRL